MAVTDNIQFEFQAMSFHGRMVTNSQTIIDVVETSFGMFDHPPAQHDPEIIFYFFEHDLDDGLSAAPVFRQNGSIIYQTVGRDSSLMLDQARGLAYGYFSPRVLADQAFFRWHFLEMAFFSMLAPRGIMGVHGAAVVKNKRAILLRAASGGGKTTLAYACARDSFQALAEDVVWLDVKRGQWWGMPWAFHLLPDAKTLFPELQTYQPCIQTNGELKLEVNLEDIRSGSTVASAQPGPVVLVERTPGGRSRLEPLVLKIAKSQWFAGVAGTELSFPDYEAHIEALLRDNTYCLFFGDDIDAAVNLLGTLV